MLSQDRGAGATVLFMSVRTISAFIAAAALLGAAGAAHAADGKGVDFTVRTEPAASPTGTKSLKWDAQKGRWGLTLDLAQPDRRESNLNDVQAGAYFRITPSLRVGGAVALGDRELDPAPKKLAPEGQPRVRLETAFKF